MLPKADSQLITFAVSLLETMFHIWFGKLGAIVNPFLLLCREAAAAWRTGSYY